MTPLPMSAPKDLPMPPFLRRYWPVLVLALVPLIPLFRAVFMGEAIGPFDQIRQMAPWNGPKQAQAWDVLQADGVLQFYVWRDLVFDAWGKGQIPFWNHYQLAGTPLLGNSQSGVLYPPHIAMGVLHVPTAMAMTLLAWLHLFWAGLGVYVLARAVGANRVGGVIAGVGFSLSNFMIAWTGLPSVIETVAWIPWALGLTVLLFGSQEGRWSKLLMPALGLSLGMMILAGHLQFVAYCFLGVGLLVVWLLATRRSPQPVGAAIRVVVGAVLGVCIAAPQLLAVLQYSQFSHRKNTASEEGYAAYTGSAIQPYELVKLVAPSLQGDPRQVVSDQLPVSSYYPAILKPGANFAESALGIGAFGVLLLCLLPLVAKWREPVWGVLLGGLVAFLLAMGTPLNKLLYFGVPGWSSTGSPGRAICLFVLAVCVGAGLAASRMDELGQLLKTNARALMFAGGGFLALCLVCFATKNGYELRQGLTAEVVDTIKGQAESASLSSVLGVTLLSLLAIGFALKEQSLRSRAVLLCVPILSSVAFFGMTLIQTGKPDLTVKNSVGSERIAVINKAWDIFQAAHATLPPNLAALNRIHSLDGYDSLLHRDTVALLHDIDGDDAAPKVNGNMMFIKPSADMGKLADAGVTQVWSQDAMPALGAGSQEDGFYKYKLAGPGRASTPVGAAEIVSESPSQIQLKAKGPGKLIVRERNMPGWLPKVDGAHVALGGSTWMEMDLPAGEHQVELNYVPPGFTTGVVLALLGWLVLLFLAFKGGLFARVLGKRLTT